MFCFSCTCFGLWGTDYLEFELFFWVLLLLLSRLFRFNKQLSVPDESPLRDRPEEERVPLRLGALDKVSLEADEKTEIEREKQVKDGVVSLCVCVCRIIVGGGQ